MAAPQALLVVERVFVRPARLVANANYSRTATNGVTPTTAQTTSSSSGWLMYSVWGYRPVTPPGQDILDSMLDEAVDGSNDYRFNPVKTAKNEYRKTLVDYLNANLALTWKITPDLTFKTTGGYVLNKRRREEFNGSETYTGYAGSPSGKGVNGFAGALPLKGCAPARRRLRVGEIGAVEHNDAGLAARETVDVRTLPGQEHRSCEITWRRTLKN